jgi:hypothetical protein
MMNCFESGAFLTSPGNHRPVRTALSPHIVTFDVYLLTFKVHFKNVRCTFSIGSSAIFRQVVKFPPVIDPKKLVKGSQTWHLYERNGTIKQLKRLKIEVLLKWPRLSMPDGMGDKP